MNHLSTSTKPVPISWVDSLFSKMAANYGTKFADMWTGLDLKAIKETWAAELGKLTRDELLRGVNSLSTQDWPPTLPQFMKLCRIKIDPLAAYYQAVNGVVARERGEVGEWTHPAIFWASVRVGAFDLKNHSHSAIKARWEEALHMEIMKGEWDEIPAAVISLPAPAQKVSKEVADKFIEETSVIKSASSRTDHKLWAKRIMKRHQDGDKTLLPIQINMAKEALEAHE